MPLEFSVAKNGSKTCSFNNNYLHSSYNPENESKRFSDSVSCDFIPDNIIIIEPGLGYCFPFLKEKFPNAKIYAIRFLDAFISDSKFDKDFFFSDINSLEQELFNYFGETGLLSSLFISWPPSAKIFADKDKELWTLLKKLISSSQSILATRQFFAKRWIKNQFIFLNNLSKCSHLDNIDLPVAVCASGPSLKDSLPFLRKYHSKLFIIACSSAIKPLLENNIIPDLCISTDGGFWAKKHLYCLKSFPSIPIALTAEGTAPSFIYKNNPVIPLSYNDNFDNQIFDSLGLYYTNGKRNGTISGTAVELALSITSNKVFALGLDLEASKGFVHTQKNQLELEASIHDNLLSTKEKRIYSQNKESPQLEIYRNWFRLNSASFDNRLYRLSDNYNYKNTLGTIKDINWQQFELIVEIHKLNDKKISFKEFTVNISKSKIKEVYTTLLSNKDWIETYFPADCIAIKRSIDKVQKEKYTTQLNSKLTEIKNYIEKN